MVGAVCDTLSLFSLPSRLILRSDNGLSLPLPLPLLLLLLLLLLLQHLLGSVKVVAHNTVVDALDTLDGSVVLVWWTCNVEASSDRVAITLTTTTTGGGDAGDAVVTDGVVVAVVLVRVLCGTPTTNP